MEYTSALPEGETSPPSERASSSPQAEEEALHTRVEESPPPQEGEITPFQGEEGFPGLHVEDSPAPQARALEGESSARASQELPPLRSAAGQSDETREVSLNPPKADAEEALERSSLPEATAGDADQVLGRRRGVSAKTPLPNLLLSRPLPSAERHCWEKHSQPLGAQASFAPLRIGALLSTSSAESRLLNAFCRTHSKARRRGWRLDSRERGRLDHRRRRPTRATGGGRGGCLAGGSLAGSQKSILGESSPFGDASLCNESFARRRKSLSGGGRRQRSSQTQKCRSLTRRRLPQHEYAVARKLSSAQTPLAGLFLGPRPKRRNTRARLGRRASSRHG